MARAGEDHKTIEAKRWLAHGADHLRQARPREAVRAFEHLVKLSPNDAHAWHRLGDALAWAGEGRRAAEALRRSVALDPAGSAAWGRLGNVLSGLRDPEGAIQAFRAALAIRPDSVELLCNLGEALSVAGAAGEAIEPLERAINLAPAQPIAHLNLGCALMRLGQAAEAQARFERAVALAPQLAQAHLNLAMALLMQEQYARGWREMEWRLERPRAASLRRAAESAQLWTGQSLEEKSILLHAEQGYGDAFQFIRYVPLVAQRARRVILSCRSELAELLRSAGGIDEVAEARGAPPAADFCAGLVSLPMALGIDEPLAANVPYLHPTAEKIAVWQERLRHVGGLKIGLAWAGNPSNTRDRYRSMRFEQIRPLLDLPRVSWICLQKSPRGEGDSFSSHFALDPAADLHDWSDTAALLMNLALVVTVDTAIAHLAGALGRPTWTMLSFGADWRWLTARADSPWYPTMRLFRQPAAGDWDAVVQNVKTALAGQI